MSFVDMAFLRKSDLSNGYISYRRRKTGQLMMIEWTPEMQAILSKYPLNPSHFLLPIIKNTIIDQRCAYRNAGYIINHNLKSIGKMIGLENTAHSLCGPPQLGICGPQYRGASQRDKRRDGS